MRGTEDGRRRRKREERKKVMGRKGAWESGDYSGSSRVQILLHESEEAGEKWSEILALSFRVWIQKQL